ncbi:MAG: hypothetical protein AB7F86_19775 [Bdellovibrionales bacterium]
MPQNIGSVLRWNANFVRGLASSVLERAKAIRGSLASDLAEDKSAKETKLAKKASAHKRKTKGKPKRSASKSTRRRS